MESFAFIVNPKTIKRLKGFWPFRRILPVRKIQSIQKKEINGFFIISPPEKILAYGHIAKRLGVKVMGLNGNASYLSDKDYNTITRELKIPVTCGSAFTAWSIFEAIYRVTKIKKINLKKSHLAIIGANNSIGSLCARKLSDYIGIMAVVDKERDKLERLKETILHLNPIEVIIEEDAHQGVKNADIVINTDNSPELEFGLEDLKSNAIVCDISLSNNIFKKLRLRKDITVIRGGLIKLPYPIKVNINSGLPRGIILASMAETMLLAFEEKFVSYSLGESMNLDRLEEIADIAVRHGFEVWVPEAPVL